MQKKIIALAVASLVSGAALAQTAPNNVTVWGIVDMGYLYQGSNIAPGGDNYSGIDSGGHDGSRFGFTGEEDLGNGLSAGFYTRFNFQSDYSGTLAVSKNYAYLSGKTWGKVTAGNFANPVDDAVAIIESKSMGWGNTVVAMRVQDIAYNAAKYTSPNWGGFDFTIGYSTQYQNAQDVATSAESPAWFAGANFKSGGLKLAFGMVNVKRDSIDGKKSEYALAGDYDFGAFRVGAAYNRASIDTNTRNHDRDAWVINGGWSITPIDQLTLSYSASTHDYNTAGVSDYDTSAWGLSYTHAFSKRTNFYASAYTADAPNGFITMSSDFGTTVKSNFENAAKFGIRHKF